jgi:2-polyprenyl-3-methyl-5-hydroxy-6-metoxy-1,4-benzoquinol methylase
MTANEWYKEWFSSPYYDILYYKRNQQEAVAFIQLLINHLKPPPLSRMLDVACGKGRHSKALAEMGFDVTGIDLSEPFINEAKRWETEHLHFFQHDMRSTFYINYFNYAFNFFTSFGYFRTRREHDDAMRTIAQSLKLNGVLVIDYLNAHYAEDHLVSNEEIVLDDTLFKIRRWHDEERFFKEIQIEEPNNSARPVFTEKVAKFNLGDFTDMLSFQHMQVQEVFGDYNLGPYDIRKSPRMIIIAKKILP